MRAFSGLDVRGDLCWIAIGELSGRSMRIKVVGTYHAGYFGILPLVLEEQGCRVALTEASARARVTNAGNCMIVVQDCFVGEFLVQ